MPPAGPIDLLTNVCHTFHCSTKALGKRNRLFRDALTPHEFMELDGEEEDEEVKQERMRRFFGRFQGNSTAQWGDGR